MTRNQKLRKYHVAWCVVACALSGGFSQACKTYRVAPDDGGDGMKRDSAFDASVTDRDEDGAIDIGQIDMPDANGRVDVGVDLAGEVNGPVDAGGVRLEASTSSIDFGSVLMGGQVSSLVPVTVRNVGTVPSGVLHSTIPTGDFGIGADGCTGTMLGSGASCSISLTFGPATAGASAKTSSLSVTASPGGEVGVVLSGKGVTLALDQTSFVFPTTATGNASLSRTFTVSNPTSGSAGALIGLSIALVGASPAEFQIDSTTCSGRLGGAGQCGISVSFHPISFGMRTAILSASATPGGTVTASLSGQGQAQDGQFGCMTNDDCQSADCTAFYRDGDGDGFGDRNKPANVCGFNPPNGYASSVNGFDCDDLDPSMYPGVERCQSTTTRAYCPIAGDVNAGVLQVETCAGGACLDTACVGTVNESGLIACGVAGNCTAAQGCSFELGRASSCNRFQSEILDCDDGSDCPAGSVCCAAHACVAFINQSCYAGGCPVGDSCTHYGQLCNPLSPDCPAGTSCKPTFTLGALMPQGQWGCIP